MYLDPSERVEIQFYTYEGYFQLYVFIEESNTYFGDTWNNDFINGAFTNFPEWIDIFPEFETANGFYEFYNGTAENNGEPYLELYVYDATLEETLTWLNTIEEEGKLFSFTSVLGDDEGCEGGCETGADAFVNHGYELYTEETMCLMVEVDNHLDDLNDPYVEIEVLYFKSSL